MGILGAPYVVRSSEVWLYKIFIRLPLKTVYGLGGQASPFVPEGVKRVKAQLPRGQNHGRYLIYGAYFFTPSSLSEASSTYHGGVNLICTVTNV